MAVIDGPQRCGVSLLLKSGRRERGRLAKCGSLGFPFIKINRIERFDVALSLIIVGYRYVEMMTNESA